MAMQMACNFAKGCLNATNHMEMFLPCCTGNGHLFRLFSQSKCYNAEKSLSISQREKRLCSQAFDSVYQNGLFCDPLRSCSKSHIMPMVKPLTVCVGYVSTFWRGFSTTAACGGSQMGMGKDRTVLRTSSSDQIDWVVRLAIENGYLSWCRNSYLTTVIAIAMMGEGTTALTEQAAEGAFFLAGLNLSWGTYQYIYNLLHLRHKTGTSLLGTFLYISVALLHLALWIIVCSLYLGFTEDEDEKELVSIVEEEQQEKGDDV